MKQKQGLCAWPEYQGQAASIHQAAEKMPSCNLLRLPALRPVCDYRRRRYKHHHKHSAHQKPHPTHLCSPRVCLAMHFPLTPLSRTKGTNIRMPYSGIKCILKSQHFLLNRWVSSVHTVLEDAYRGSGGDVTDPAPWRVL